MGYKTNITGFSEIQNYRYGGTSGFKTGQKAVVHSRYKKSHNGRAHPQPVGHMLIIDDEPINGKKRSNRPRHRLSGGAEVRRAAQMIHIPLCGQMVASSTFDRIRSQ